MKNKLIKQIVELKFDMFKENKDLYKNILDSNSKKKVIKKYNRLYKEKKIKHIMIKKKNQIIGLIACININENVPYFFYKENYKVGYIGDFYIHKEYRNQGFGDILIKKAIKYFNKKNYKVVNLLATQHSMKLFKNNGFKTNNTYLEL